MLAGLGGSSSAVGVRGVTRAAGRCHKIAEALGISPRAVSMRLYRALERLSAELARRA